MGSFVRGLRWLGHHSPLRGCSGLAASGTPKIPRRRTPLTFQTGSKELWREGTLNLVAGSELERVGAPTVNVPDPLEEAIFAAACAFD